VTLWSAFERREPAIAGRSTLALSVVRSAAVPDSRSYRNLGFSEIAADIAADPSTVAFGVYGSGAWVLDSEQVVPALFVQPGMAEPGGAHLENSELGALVPPPLRGELADVRAIPLAQPSAYATTVSPGAPITIGSRSATSGIWVRCRTTQTQGFLTAGHAAPTMNVLVRDDQGTAVGRVLRSLHRGIGSSITATADVAVIEPKTGVSIPGPGLPIQSVAAKDQIALQVSRGSSTSWIRGLSPSFAVSPTDQPWGEVGLTASAISIAGDSGAPITANGHVVASLVGGARHDYSVVQDIEYQLTELRADAI
jgi:hypothetical protein